MNSQNFETKVKSKNKFFKAVGLYRMDFQLFIHKCGFEITAKPSAIYFRLTPWKAFVTEAI